MPTYDFKCKTCGHRFSQRVAIKDRELVRCPQCGGEVQQLFTGFLYCGKGSGGSCSGNCGSCGVCRG
ncbi:MAG TPA: zinc ribbon domain-containing protein [Moorella mulderi]|nr:zinc ribbon domain-containing protein [Moorella mulderi]